MKHHKIAYAVWLVFNLIAYAILTIALRSIHNTDYKTMIVGLNGNLYLYIFAISIYTYCFAYLWDFLQEHIALSDDINERETKKNGLIFVIDSISQLIISQALISSFILPIWYWMIRFVVLAFGWLKYGEWIQYTSCDAIQTFCSFNSSFVGINIIMNWFSENDFGYLLTLICFSLCFIFSKHPKYK
jgi:hypothetical protein